MESSVILYASFRNIFDKNFIFSDFGDRLRIQKMAYLVHALGVRLGDYGFRWYKRGPYSQAVQDDAIFVSSHIDIVNSESSRIVFTPKAESTFLQIKSFIANKPSVYNDAIWLEAIASLHYLRKRMNYDDEHAILYLEEVKPHLSNREANELALRQVEQIC